MVPLSLLLGLLGANAAMEMGQEHTIRLQRILDSPVVQTLADRLDLQLPDVPQFNIDIQNIDINALADQASSMGCLPEGVQFSDDARDTIRDCGSQAYQSVKRAMLARPTRRQQKARSTRNNRRRQQRNQRTNRGRSGRSVIDKMKERVTALGIQHAQQCIVKGLNLLADNGQLNQTAVIALIDDMTAADDFKTEQKENTRLCISATPGDLNDSNQRLMFQLQCVSELNSLQCMLGVADGVSPTLGFAARLKAGKCLAKGLTPPARAMMAKAACISEEVSSMMRDRLEETAPASGGRRRRDADLMMAMQNIGGLEGMERAIGAGSTRPPCQPKLFKPCPPQPPAPSLTTKELNETLARAEEVLGPLDEMFASLPERAYSTATCWHETMNTVSDDGSVDVEALKEVVAEFSGPQELTDTLTNIVSTCGEPGSTASSVESFTECVNSAAAYACQWLRLLTPPTDD